MLLQMCCCCHRAVELPLVRQGCRIFILWCRCVLRGFVTLTRNLCYRIFCATLCLFLKPSNRKFPCLESFNFETPLRKWNIFWLRNRTPCLPEEQNRRYRDATLYLSNMRFWSKSQGVGPSKMENILWRKCTSDITAGRAVLYRVTKNFEKISLQPHISKAQRMNWELTIRINGIVNSELFFVKV